MRKATTYYSALDTNTLYEINLVLYYDGKPDYETYGFDDLAGIDYDYKDYKGECRKIDNSRQLISRYGGVDEYLASDEGLISRYEGSAEYIELIIDSFSDTVRMANDDECGDCITSISGFAEEAASERAFRANLFDDENRVRYEITEEDWEEARKYHWELEVRKTPLG